MKIAYEKGFMVVTHPTGHINKYSKDDLLKLKQVQQRSQNELATQISNIDMAITNVESSKNG